MSNHHIELCLASSSKYKELVLAKLGIPFTCTSPNIDESPLVNETADDLVKRLSFAKAKKALEQTSIDTKVNESSTFYIGVDQVAVFNNQIIGKSHTREEAIKQLTSFSGNTVKFLTGISLIKGSGQATTSLDEYIVTFKKLTQKQISAYVDAENPLDCAGSFKCEGVGILLFSAMQGRDINSLIGMPLLSLQELFLEFGVDLFDYINPDNSSS